MNQPIAVDRDTWDCAEWLQSLTGESLEDILTRMFLGVYHLQAADEAAPDATAAWCCDVRRWNLAAG